MSARMMDLPGGAEASDYSTVFLPWGPEWTAEKCAMIMRRKDHMLNNEYANGFRGYVANCDAHEWIDDGLVCDVTDIRCILASWALPSRCCKTATRTTDLCHRTPTSS